MITERIQATGSWDLNLRPDTPRRIRDLIEPFTMIAVFPTQRLITGGSDSALRAAARWMGVVTSPGAQQLTIGGSGLALLLGDDEGRSFHIDTPILPVSEISTTGYTANQWIDALLQGTYFARGITTGLTGTMEGTYQWVTPREVLEAVTAYWGAEWRVNHREMTVDVSSVTNLYGGINLALISPQAQGRGLQKFGSYRGIAGVLATAADVQSYASQIALLGSANTAVAGGASSFCGGTLTVTRVVEASDVPLDATVDTALAFLSRMNTQRNEVSISTAEYDVSGKLEVGDGVFIYDPDNGLEDVTASPIEYHGEIMRPVYVRCFGQTWPVRAGMAVGLRVDNGASGITWHDLTPYIVPDEGDATIEIGANQRYVTGDDLALRTNIGPRLKWSPWQAYAATFAQTGGTLNPGNAVIDTRYRREGSRIEVIGRVAIGTTTVFATGLLAVILPTGLGVSAYTGTQLGTATFTDASAAAVYGGQAYISPASPGTIFFRASATPMTDVTQAAPFAWAAGDELQFSITIELSP